jgi:tRNA pseudouridine38-40 synthase
MTGAPVKNTRLLLAYDGTDYHGWQRQPEAPTVQGALEDALFKLTGKKIAVLGAGRTDAGVHAAGQTANFRGALKLEDADLFRALNAVLPNDIRVLSLDRAPESFHARKSALGKTYRYRIVHAPLVSPFDFRFALHIPYPLDVRAMRHAAALFAREADFSSFTSNRECNAVRRVTLSRLEKRGDELIYTIEADGFLRYMVRTIVGTLLEVGRRKIRPEAVGEIFAGRNRNLAGPTAPARGLCLMRVRYGEGSPPPGREGDD